MALLVCLEFARAGQTDDPFAFEFGAQSYLLRSEGGVFTSAVFSWDEATLSQLQELRRPGRDPALRQHLGERLRQFLEAAGWAELEQRILAAQHEQALIVLQVRSAAAELYALPWELLALRATGQHLGELPQLLLRYEWPRAEPAAALPPCGPGVAAAGGRILVAWSAAGGAVPAAEHIAAVQQACQGTGHPFNPETDVLSALSGERLGAALAAATNSAAPVAVLHLLCHGRAAGSTFGLVFEDDSGGPMVMDAGRLRQLLAPFAATLQLVVLAACDSGNAGAPGNQLGSVAQALHRLGISSVVASRYPLSVSGSIHLAQVLYQQLLGESTSLESALLAVRQRLGQDADPLDWASLQIYSRSAAAEQESWPLEFRPFRGLLNFQPEDARFFFGREPEIAEICNKLAALTRDGEPRFLVVAGASGSGKSSLVLAGAVPHLMAADKRWQLVCLRPGHGATELDALLAAAAEPTRPRLIVVDQLEELFTLIDDPAARTAWIRRLWRLAGSPAGHVVLVTIRIDYLGRGSELVLSADGRRMDAVSYAERHRVLVAQMTQDALRRIITEPAKKVGLTLEDGLIERMLRDVEAAPGALPLLEDTLDELWQRRRGRTLTESAYDAIEGVNGSLRRRADALLASLTKEEQLLARRLLVRLVHISEDVAAFTRRRVLAAAVRPRSADDQAAHARVLGQLVAARLVLTSGEGDGQSVEVAHEALIRQWPRLQEWVRADRALLAQLKQVEDWVAAWRAYGTLLTGEPLAITARLAVAKPDEISSDTLALLAASRRRARSRLRFRRATLVVLGLMVAVPLLYALGLRRSANHEWQILELFGAMAISLLLNLITLPTLVVLVWRSGKAVP